MAHYTFLINDYTSDSHLNDTMTSLSTHCLTLHYVKRGWGTPIMCVQFQFDWRRNWNTTQNTDPVKITAVNIHVIIIYCFLYGTLKQSDCNCIFSMWSFYLWPCKGVLSWHWGSISYRDSPDLQLWVDCFLNSIRDPPKWQMISAWHITTTT